MSIPPPPPVPQAPVPAPAPTPAPAPAPTRTKMRGRTKALIAAGAAVVLLGGGGVAAATFLFNSPTPTADRGIPSSVDGVVIVNLNPSNADKLALREITEKFPDLDTKDAGDDYKKALWNLIPDSSDKPDYETEVKTWLGDSAAFGFTIPADSSGSPEFIASVQITNEDAARSFAEKYIEHLEPTFRDDLMILTDADSPWTEADITGASIADDKVYQSDIARLDGSNLLAAWASPSLSKTMLESAQGFESAQGSQGLPPSTVDLSAYEDAHGAAGLQVSSGSLAFKAVGEFPNLPTDDGVPADVRDLAGSFDAASLGVVALGVPDSMYDQIWEFLESDRSFQRTASDIGITSADDLRALLGVRWGASVTVDDQSQPIVGAKFQTEDPARQKELLDGIDDLIANELQSSRSAVEVAQEGDTAIVAFGQDLADVTSPEHQVGALDSYKKIVDASAQAVLFVNVDAITELPTYLETVSNRADVAQWLMPISAAGVTVSQSADNIIATKLQIVFD